MITFSLTLLFWVGYWHDINLIILSYDRLFWPLPLLIGPTLYFSFKPGDWKLRPFDLLHGLPAILVFGISLTAHILEITGFSLFIYIVHGLSFLIYFFFSLKDMEHRRNSLWNIKTLVKQDKYTILIMLYGLFGVLALFNLAINKLLKEDLFLDLPLAITICALIYITGLILGTTHLQSVSVSLGQNKKYARSSLKAEMVPRMLRKMQICLEDQKPWLNQDYRLKDFSLDVDIPAHHISEVLNTFYDRSYAELINYYRIKEAEKLLNQNRGQSLANIGYDVGFNSRAMFYYWFKRFHQKSPGEYINSRKNV